MKQVTVVTGPMRSGTSCLTGLLEQFGYNLGSHVRVLRKPSAFNPKGHFELDLLFAINERLIVESHQGQGDIFNVCGQDSIALLARQRTRYFRMFLDKFDGNLCKDPLFCLTLPYWQAHWPEQKNTVFCLRHPYAAAKSMVKRYAISEALAVKTWLTYTQRFFDYVDQSTVFIFDFDRFVQSPLISFSELLAWLELSADANKIKPRIDGFFAQGFVHWHPDGAQFPEIYQEALPLYRQLKRSAENRTAC